MVKIKGMKIERAKVVSEFMEVPRAKCGSVVVVLFYAPWTEDQSKRENSA